MAEIAIASPMLPPRLTLNGGVEAHRQFLEENGYTGGLELHVARYTKLTRELARRSTEHSIDDAARFIRSGHQSFISTEQGMVPRSNLKEVARAIAAVAFFPRADTSLHKLTEYQRGINRDQNLSVVVYPEIDRPEGFGDLPFAEKLFQPNVRVMKQWGIETIDDMVVRAKEAGLTGIAWDGYHYLRTADDGFAMPDWHDVLPQFLDASSAIPVREAHVSVGRSDRTENGSLMDATRDELSIFLSEPDRIGDTTTGQMLKVIHGASDGDMRYVVESQFSRSDMPAGMSPREAYAALAGNLALFLDSF